MNVPAAHCWHGALAPSRVKPGEQRQAPAPAAEVELAGHVEQTDSLIAPLAAEKVLAGHRSQAAEPFEALNCPCGHAVQRPPSSAAPVKPGRQ